MKSLVLIMSAALLLGGCANMGAGMKGVSQVAATAPGLALQLDNVYAYLVAQKVVPDHTAEATKALAALDAIAPAIQQGANSLSGDKFNWAQFVVQAALTTAQVMGFVLPLL